MNVQAIRVAVRRQPFQSFTLRMNDGREFYIPHPEYVAVSSRFVLVVDAATEAGIFLEPLLIASLEPGGRPPRPSAEASTEGSP